MWVAVPGTADVGGGTGENGQYIGIAFKCPVVICSLHDMSPQYLLPIVFFDKDRDLGSDRFSRQGAPRQKGKWILCNEFADDLGIFFFVVGEIVHGNRGFWMNLSGFKSFAVFWLRGKERGIRREIN